MEEYKSNSFKSKESKANNTGRIVSSSTKLKTKTNARKIADTLIAGTISDVMTHFVTDIVVPSIQRAITDSINILLYGNDAPEKRRNSGQSNISYWTASNRAARDRRYDDYRSRGAASYDEIIFDNRGEAELVLDKMDEIIASYGVVSLLDFYEMAGQDCPYTYRRYGWTDIRGASVIRTRDGYLIKLPKAMPID